MEIIKKAIISVRDNFEEVEAVVDTGADRTMIDEEVLLKIGAPHLTNLIVQSMGEVNIIKPLYAAVVEIDGCKFGLTVTGGRKNLIGHDFLQLAKAIINEENGTVRLTKDYIEM